MKIGVIGAGVAGLAAAARLASQGHTVEVFEANAYPGGKLSEFTHTTADGRTYRFDAGPSLFTMPAYVEAVFEAAQEPMAPYFDYDRLPVVCQYFWEDGTALTAYAEPEKFAQEAADKLGVAPQSVLKALSSAAHKYETAGRIFLEKSLHKVSTWTTPAVAKSILLMPTFDIFKTMHKTHEKALKHPKLVQFFDRFATYNGSNPYKASGMLSVIPHFEHGIGTFYPKGGMFAITEALYRLGEKKGVKFHFNTKIAEILTENGAVKGLKTAAGDCLDVDTVVSNMDVYFTYKKLLPHIAHPEKTLAQERSTSALIFYWGVKKQFSQLHLHNIFFANNYKAEFEALNAGTIADDITIYANITSKLTPSDAPSDGENWFILINAPFNSGQDWAALTDRVRQQVVEKLSRMLNVDFQSLIETEDILTPLSIEAKTQSFTGSLYGTSSNNMMSAFLRHANFSSEIKNLYFCGGSVHPGGGIPLCLLSAKIVSELIPST